MRTKTKNENINLRLTRTEKKAFEKAARRDGQDVSAWIRTLAHRRAVRVERAVAKAKAVNAAKVEVTL